MCGYRADAGTVCGCYVAGGEPLPGLSLLPEKPLRPAPWSRVKGGIWNPSNHRSRSIDQFNQSRRPMTPTPFSQSHSILTSSLDRGEQQVGDASTVVGIWRYHRRSYTHDSLSTINSRLLSFKTVLEIVTCRVFQQSGLLTNLL